MTITDISGLHFVHRTVFEIGREAENVLLEILEHKVAMTVKVDYMYRYSEVANRGQTLRYYCKCKKQTSV